MWIFIALTVSLLLSTAVIAHVSDTLGKKLGKKRVSVLGLRPRHSATVLTVASSWAIMGFTMLVLLLVYAPLKNAIFHFESEQARFKSERTRFNQDRRIAEERLKTATDKLATTTDKLQSARRGEEKARREFETAQKQQRAAVTKFQSAQKALQVSQNQLKGTKSDLSKRQTQVAEAQSRLARASQELAQRQLQVKEAQAQLKTATAARIQADAAALQSKQAAYRAGQSAFRAGQAAYRAGKQALGLQKEVVGLQAEKEGLRKERESLRKEKKSLQTEKESLKADVEQLNAEIQLTSAIADHQKADAANLWQVAIRDIRLPVDQTLAERRLDAAQNPEQIQKELRYLVETAQAATKNFLPEATVFAGTTVTDPDKSGGIDLDETQTIQFFADRLAQINKPISARLVSALNYPVGEKVVLARFVFVPIRTVYASRENITEGVIEANKSEAAVFGQLQKLVDSARFNAVKRGASPPLSPDEQNFFDGDTGQKLFDALRQVQKIGRPVSVRIVAARDLDSAEPLQVRFVVGTQA